MKKYSVTFSRMQHALSKLLFRDCYCMPGSFPCLKNITTSGVKIVARLLTSLHFFNSASLIICYKSMKQIAKHLSSLFTYLKKKSGKKASAPKPLKI